MAWSSTWLSTVHEESCPDIGPICAERAEPPQLHDQSIALFELSLGARYQLSPGWSVRGRLPLRLVRSSIVFRDLAGRPLALDYQNIHHRDETLAGLGDPALDVSHHWLALGHAFSLTLGALLPLGRVEADPFAAAAAGQEHQHFQHGTGTYRPVVGLSAGGAWAPLAYHAFGVAILSFFENEHRYQAGHRLAAGAGLSLRLTAGIELAGGLQAQVELAERWAGVVPTTDGNRGRTDLLLDLGATLSLGSARVGLGVKLPLYTHVVGGQLEYPAILELSASHGFGEGG